MTFLIGITSDFQKKSEIFWKDDFNSMAKYFDSGLVYSLKKFSHLNLNETDLSWNKVGLWASNVAAFFALKSILLDRSFGLKTKFNCVLALCSFVFLFFRTNRPMPDCVICFWSHYPGVVLRFFSYISEITGANIKIIGFAGAYDLVEYSSLTLSNLPYANFRFTHCDINKVYIEKHLGLPIARIYRGTDLASFSPTVKKSFKPPEERCYAYIGRFDETKNIHKILPWFAKALEVFPDIKLRIIGDGPFQFSLRKQIADMCIPEETISIEGWKTRDQLIEVFTQIDVLIQPSDAKYERLPNIIKEALASGVVPISGPSEGINELITDEWGEVFDFLKSPSVEEMPKIFSESSDEMATKAALGRIHISEYFDRKKNIAELVKQMRPHDN